jgi:serine/threonine-protein kinase
VFAAEHVRTGRPCAVKMLHPELIARGPALARFRTEAEQAGAIVHERVVAILDYDADEGAPYLVMELLQGETLRSLLQREGRIEPSRALHLIAQCCEGVEAAHAHGLVHRDLKPENLFVVGSASGTESVKVLDFGLAKAKREAGSSEQTKSGTLVGTTRYMAPEQLKAPANVDARADVYALGLVLYEMLSGRPAFAPSDLHAEMQQVLFEKPAPLESLCRDLPLAVVKVVERAMARDPAQRPASARELGEALRRAWGASFVRSSTTPTPREEPITSLPPTIADARTTRAANAPFDPLQEISWRPRDRPRAQPEPPTLREVTRRLWGLVRLSWPLVAATTVAGLILSLATCLPQ